MSGMSKRQIKNKVDLLYSDSSNSSINKKLKVKAKGKVLEPLNLLEFSLQNDS
jgi:hypothetical protein